MCSREPSGGARPVLIVAQHLPVAHTGILNDPFQIKVAERYAKRVIRALYRFLHWWPTMKTSRSSRRVSG